MKKMLLGAATGLIAIGIAAPVSAADIAAGPYPYRAAPPPYVAPIYQWTGFYIGANGGWGSSHKCWDLTNNGFGPIPAFAEGCHNATGGVAGGQIGYRWQTGTWVWGLEGQGNWADLRGSNVSLFDPFFQNRSRIDAFGLLTGQVGWAWNNVLLYVKGGGAVTGDRFDVRTSLGNVLVATGEDQTSWGGRLGLAWNLVLHRAGRPASNTITCSCRTKMSASSTPAAYSSQPTASGRTSIWSPCA
jgi:outer membrane immunogenic protein